MTVGAERVTPEQAGGGGGTHRPRLDPSAFTASFEASADALWCVAVGVLGPVGRSEAEDVLQESAVIALGKLGEFDASTNFVAWMGEIVRNVARNVARKRVRRHTAPVDPVALDEAHADTRTAGTNLRPGARIDPDVAGFDDRVVDALGTLEETARTCLLMRTLHEVPYRDISLVLGIPEGTAMSHVHRARQTLRRLLSGDDTARPSSGHRPGRTDR